MTKLHFQARLAITGPRDKMNLDQFAISGVLLGHPNQEKLSTSDDNWNMVECEVIITPKKIHKGIKEQYKNCRLDQVAQLVGDEDYWTEHVTYDEDPLDEFFLGI